VPRRATGPAAVEGGIPPSCTATAPTHTQVLGLKLFAPLKLMGPYKPRGAKSYQVKGVSRLDHGMITAKPARSLCRSAVRLTAVRNPQAWRVPVIQITIIL
jgi:hypothetical protein